MAPRRRPLRLVISAGPTREPLDAVRFLSNYSTGSMGVELARAARTRGHRVTMVCGPMEVPPPSGIRVVRVETAAQMAKALRRAIRRTDALLMAAAVADFRPVRVRAGKARRRGAWTLRLRATPDVLRGLPRRPGQIRVGFALEPGNAVAAARRKLRTKRLDVVFAQHLNGHGGPFGPRPVRAWLLARGGRTVALGRHTKAVAARLLLDKVEALCYGQIIHDR